MSIMTQLEFELNFSESEKNIAHYILNNGELVLNQSIQELAKRTYTSPATIVRLCKKLGLDGYNDFKIKYSAELQYDSYYKERIDVNFPFTKKDSPSQIAHKISSLYNEVVFETMQLLNYEQLESIVKLLHQYDHIDIYGYGNSLLAAMSFQHKMMRIQKQVNLKILQGEQVFMSYNSTHQHVAIIVSYSGETNDLIRTAQILKQKQTPIIVLTSIGDNRLSHYATHLLHMGSREKIFTKIAPFASQISMEYLFNIIFSCLFQLNYDQYIENKLHYDKQYDARHPISSPIIDE